MPTAPSLNEVATALATAVAIPDMGGTLRPVVQAEIAQRERWAQALLDNLPEVDDEFVVGWFVRDPLSRNAQVDGSAAAIRFIVQNPDCQVVVRLIPKDQA